MGTLRVWACVAMTAVATCHGQTAPTPKASPRAETPPGFVPVDVRMEEGKLVLTEGGRELLSPVSTVLEPTDPGVKGELAFRSAPGGADLMVTFSNLTDNPRPVTDLSLGLFTLTSGVRLRDMRLPFTTQSIDLNTYIPRGAVYPLETYSPALVFADERLAVGVSVSYPVLAYRHDIEFTLHSPRDLKAGGKRAWMVKVAFSKNGKDRAGMRPAMLAPRESRRYIVHIRASAAAEWLRTLLPYREYFRAQYGPVRYSRDGAPLAGFEVATASSISDNNPAGWVMPFRPDELGWTNISRFLCAEFNGWPTVLVGNPSGLYNEQRQNNPPFQFATPWLASRALQSATDAYNGFPAVVKQGKKVAFRWGHSASVAYGWNPDEYEPLNPENTEHVGMALNEADLAAKAGVTTILLDSFSHRASPLWNLAPWAEVLRRRYPDVRFVASPAPCDVLHAIVPGCTDASVGAQKPMRAGDPHPVTEAFVMADFLLPGHETWASVRFDGALNDVAAVEGEVHRLAALGYVPLIWSQGAADVKAVSAAPTWERTIPKDLQLPAGPKPKDAEKARAEVPAQRQGLEKITVRPAEKPKTTQPGTMSTTEQQRLIEEALRRLRATSAKANADAAKKPKIKAGGEQKQPTSEKKEDK